LHLVGPEHLPSGLLTSARQSKTQAAYLKFHAALKATPDCSRFFPDSNPAFNPRFLAEVKICPSMDYYERAWQDARRGECAREPVMEVQMPTAYDTSLAPPGHHVLSVWGLYAPVRPRVGSWDGQRQETGERLIDALSAYAPNFRDTIVHWSLFTPHDLEARIGFTDGNIRHLDMIPSQWLAQRPWVGMSEYRTPIANLYLCGAGTHPGGDVTGAPGHNAAHSVLRDLRA
jgi:phytoene dehydrogenase-like protein